MKEYTAPVAEVIDFDADYVCARPSSDNHSGGGFN